MNTTIIQVEVKEIFIPFRFKYGHALATHNGVSSVICKVISSDGKNGFGEAVPRPYVTGESCETVINDIRAIASDFINQNISFDSLKHKMETDVWESQGCFSSCAWCAFEGAVLDLLGQVNSTSIASFFNSDGKNPLLYSGSIGLGTKSSTFIKTQAYKFLGFTHNKIKVGQDINFDRINYIQKLYKGQSQFFADANCSWTKEEAVVNIEKLAKMGIEAIEEPLVVPVLQKDRLGRVNREVVLNDQHFIDYNWLRERSPIPIIADESLISPDSLKKIITYDSFDILNIRLSKCGGFCVGSKMAEVAKQEGLEIGIGAMVAESPILANEGAQFGYVLRNHRYIQGFSHKALHSRKFARGGSDLKRGASVLIDSTCHGLGLTINNKKLSKITVREVILK